MLALPEPVLVPMRFSRMIIAVLLLISCLGFSGAQTSLNDLHIVPRERASASAASIQSAGSALHLIKTEANLVLVPVSVTDGMERLVQGLGRDNFQIFEGRTPEEIRDFSTEDAPVSVGIILDSSGSMADKLVRVREAVHQFCDAANLQDEFFLIEFADEPHLAADFTLSSSEIESQLLFVHPKGRTALLDAIYMGLSKMKSAKYQKRALLIISDGGDNHSRYTPRDVKVVAKESDVMIYSIGTFDRYVPTVEEAQGPRLLSEIAEPTGGRAFVLGSAAEMPAVAHRIGTELRMQYVLAYRPTEAHHDGKWHRIKVRMRLPAHIPYLQPHFRTGYYAASY